MPESTITYNGFTFPYTTMRVSEDPRFAEDGITQIGVEYQFEISGWITANDHASFKDILTEMRCKLRTRGKAFQVQWAADGGGGPQNYWSFEGDPAGTGDDDAWGPMPGRLSLERITGGLAAAYSWSITVFKKECYDGSCNFYNATSEVLSVTRSWNHTIDPNGMCTRTCVGTLRARSLAQGADKFREYCAPPIPTNYRRVAQNYTVAPNGLELQFQIVDQEQVYTLPQPITDGNATYTVRITDFGMLATMVLSGYFEAPPDVPKSTILQKIANLAAAYFPLNAPGLVFESRELSTPIYSPNRIDFNITATAAAGAALATTPNFTLGLNELLQSPPEYTGQAQGIGAFGASTAALKAPGPDFGFDACTSTLPTPQAPQSGSSSTPSTGGGATYPTQSAGSASSSDVSAEHLAAPWIAYKEEVSYQIDSGIVYFYPKDLNLPPIRQQARPPVMRLIQSGYAVKFGQNSEQTPRPAKPIGSGIGGNGTVMDSFVQAASPEPVGDGNWNRYTIHWRYVTTVNLAFPDGNPVVAEPRFPADPRRESTKETGGTLVIPEEAMTVLED